MSLHAWTELTNEGDSVYVRRINGKLSVAVTIAGKTETCEVAARDVKHSVHDPVLVQIRTLMQRIRSRLGQ